MNIEDIKKGETYNVRVKVVSKHVTGILAKPVDERGNFISSVNTGFTKSELAAFSPISPEDASEHSTVGTLSYPERVWNELWEKYEAGLSKAMRNHIKSMTPDTANDTKNTETPTKYDPNRKFRKGDKVRLREYNGRKPYDFWHKQTIEHFGAKLDTVLADELDSGNVDIFQDAPIDELTVRVHASHLELVTPIEELEPYVVRLATPDGVEEWHVEPRNNNLALVAVFGHRHPHAKAAAEAECKRLNDEWRKEMEK